MYGGDSSVLTREQERELVILAQSGDKRALEQLVMRNQRWIYKVVSPIARYNGVDIEDAFQEGVMGFVRAVEKFEVDRNFKLISYASNWIRAYVFKYALDKTPLVRASSTQASRAAFFRLNKVRKELESRGEEATDDRMAEVLGVNVDIYRAVLAAQTKPLSLDAPMSNVHGVESASFIDSIRDDKPLQDEQLEDARESFRLTARIESAMMAVLNERERDIIKSRLMTEDGTGPTFEELGIKYGCSRERIRQIQAQALERLKRALERGEEEAIKTLPPRPRSYQKRKQPEPQLFVPPLKHVPAQEYQLKTTFSQYRERRIAELRGDVEKAGKAIQKAADRFSAPPLTPTIVSAIANANHLPTHDLPPGETRKNAFGKWERFCHGCKLFYSINCSASKQVCCSKKCAFKLRSELGLKRRKKRTEIVPRVKKADRETEILLAFCPCCDDLFEDVGRKYCSWKCRREARRKPAAA